jgi:hypothetical protein
MPGFQRILDVILAISLTDVNRKPPLAAEYSQVIVSSEFASCVRCDAVIRLA